MDRKHGLKERSEEPICMIIRLGIMRVPWGRFTTVDPLTEKYYSWSPYAYVMNSPLKYIDPARMDWVFRYAKGKYEAYYDRDISFQIDVYYKINQNKKFYHYMLNTRQLKV